MESHICGFNYVLPSLANRVLAPLARRRVRAKQQRIATQRQAEEEERQQCYATVPRRRSIRIERMRRARNSACATYPYHVALAREITPPPRPLGFEAFFEALDAQWAAAEEDAIAARWASTSNTNTTAIQGSAWISGGWGDHGLPVIDDTWRGWVFTSAGVWEFTPPEVDTELVTL
ncbi:hypothetical protein B0H16DRAFT_1741918 [Mycena metata]|uniref:Uncharacterized protein n=1 Tax=Mycena metata TaxID=1033252 RepID=A0AAD7MGN7_9AGAR|nr:hypothetical protein B0H16DRAFT_1741918 [Mycena metata]